ncbi:hypothetical protein SNEBB_001712 [Seison nebaliae]|nr:hypothetical protein SNEBB_001712 [Seison nebaliae]
MVIDQSNLNFDECSFSDMSQKEYLRALIRNKQKEIPTSLRSRHYELECMEQEMKELLTQINQLKRLRNMERNNRNAMNIQGRYITMSYSVNTSRKCINHLGYMKMKFKNELYSIHKQNQKLLELQKVAEREIRTLTQDHKTSTSQMNRVLERVQDADRIKVLLRNLSYQIMDDVREYKVKNDMKLVHLKTNNGILVNMIQEAQQRNQEVWTMKTRLSVEEKEYNVKLRTFGNMEKWMLNRMYAVQPTWAIKPVQYIDHQIRNSVSNTNKMTTFNSQRSLNYVEKNKPSPSDQPLTSSKLTHLLTTSYLQTTKQVQLRMKLTTHKKQRDHLIGVFIKVPILCAFTRQIIEDKIQSLKETCSDREEMTKEQLDKTSHLQLNIRSIKSFFWMLNKQLDLWMKLGKSPMEPQPSHIGLRAITSTTTENLYEFYSTGAATRNKIDTLKTMKFHPPLVQPSMTRISGRSGQHSNFSMSGY